MDSITPRHISVLTTEILDLMAPKLGEIWVDATVGAGGHSARILERISLAGTLLGLDQDPEMLKLARSMLPGNNVRLFHASFDQLREVLHEVGIEKVSGLLADLGFCSDQIENPQRGLSFLREGPLDMRLDRNIGLPARDILANWEEKELADLFWRFGEEKKSRQIAKKIIRMRESTPLETTTQLADLVRSVVPRSKIRMGSIDPATRVFQALRIAVNDELGALERLLKILPSCIGPAGRVGIISFHSLEDRLVKHAFKESEVWEMVTRKPVQASEEELARNPRSRSAKLRIARRR